jgi:hypothetical protein
MRLAPRSITERALLTGPLEPTNEGRAISRIAGLKPCQPYRSKFGCDFVSVIPRICVGRPTISTSSRAMSSRHCSPGSSRAGRSRSNDTPSKSVAAAVRAASSRVGMTWPMPRYFLLETWSDAEFVNHRRRGRHHNCRARPHHSERGGLHRSFPVRYQQSPRSSRKVARFSKTATARPAAGVGLEAGIRHTPRWYRNVHLRATEPRFRHT